MSVILVLRVPFHFSHLPTQHTKLSLTSTFPKLAQKLLLKLHVERIESPWPLKSGVVCPVAHNVTIAYLRPSNNSGLRIFVPRRCPCRISSGSQALVETVISSDSFAYQARCN